MKKKKRGWIWILVLVLLAVGLAILLPKLLPQAGSGANIQQYRAEKVTRGGIRVTVHGTGSLEAMETSKIQANASGTVKEVPVENGDTVKSGQLIARLDDEAVKSRIDSLNSQIASQDAAIARLRVMPGTKYITAPVDGRVKVVYASEGNAANVPMSRNGSLMVLSTDGKMKVRFTPAGGVELKSGAPVTVSVGAKDYKGILSAVPSGTSTEAEALIFTDTPAEGTPAIVKDAGGTEIGQGSLGINRPLLVTASTGKIDHLYVKAGDEVKAGSRLVRLSGAILDPSFETQLVKRQQLQDDLDKAYADLGDLDITATADGVITGLALQAGGAAQQGMTVCTIQQDKGFKLVVAVDELDIPKISIGQKASMKIDALPDEAVTGEVVKIAQIGVKANDVTTYDVTLSVSGPSGAMAQMSASADIEVAFKANTLLVPVEAVRTVDGKSWVYMAMPYDTRPGDAGADTNTSGKPGFSFPGRRANLAGQEAQRPKVEVRVGLISDAQAEILEGLNEGDEVAVPIAQSSINNMMGFGGMRNQGGQTKGPAAAGTGN